MGAKGAPRKNTLIASDAHLVQLAFKLRVSALDPNLAGGQHEVQALLAGQHAG
jgi:hypothetical protein